MSLLTPEKIISDVKGCFPLYPVPQNTGRSAYSAEVNDFFNGRSWLEVRANSLMKQSNLKAEHPFFWMNEEGYRYYLPAYIIMTLTEASDETVWMLEPFLSSLCAYTPISTFTHGATPQVDPDRLAHFNLFTPEQKKVISDFLFYQSQANDNMEGMPVSSLNYLAQLALESYWKNFLHADEN